MARKVRIYVADDEPMAVSYFKSLVKEASPDYEMAGEAFQGMQALQGIRTQKPDIAFLDISMPVMNGLELAERVLKTCPSQKIVLLTSYQDFDFVKKGLELGVCAYLLKNELSVGTLRETVEKIYGEIQLEKQRMHSYTEENLRAFLYSKSGEASHDIVYGSQPLQRFALIYLQEDLPVCLFEEQENVHGFDARILEEVEYGEGIFCRNAISIAAGKWCAILFFRAEVSDSATALQEAAKKMLEKFLEQGISVSAILSEGTKKFLDLPEMFQSLAGLGTYSFSYGKGQILKGRELEERRRQKSLEKESAMSLAYALSEEDPNAAAFLVESLLGEAAENQSRMEYIRMVRNIGDILRQFAEQWKLGISFWEEEKSFDLAGQVKDYFLGVLKVMFEQLEIQRESQYSHPVLSSQGFIQEHYSENISIQDIAREAGVSEGHLRKCFRQELGVSVVEYLTNYRIERAKKLMESRNYKISEIYSLVGFTSSQYFSYVFKKIEGITPSEYLKRV